MKKFLLLVYVLFFSCFCSLIIKYDTKIIINLYSYEIITTTKILFLIFLTIIMLNNFLIHSCYIIKKTNIDKYKKKIKKIKNLYEKYIYNISSGYIYTLNRNISLAEKKVKESENILKNRDLTILLKSQIDFTKGNYKKAIDFLYTISDKINKDYLLNNILLREAINNNDDNKVKEISNKILTINKKDYFAITTLYKLNKFDTNWLECKNLLKMIKKLKYFSKDEIIIEEKLIECNIGKEKTIFQIFKEKVKKIFAKKSL